MPFHLADFSTTKMKSVPCLSTYHPGLKFPVYVQYIGVDLEAFQYRKHVLFRFH